MKNTSFLVFGMLLFSYASNCQSRIGLKAGLNFANQVKTISIPQVPTIIEDTKYLLGYQLGVFYKAKLNEHFYLATETNFSVIGSNMMLVAADGKSYNTNEKLGYIDVPLMLQYSINKFYFGAGPSVGIKIYSRLKNFENNNYDIPYYKAIDAAGNILAGFAVSKKVDVNVRYSHGLMNIRENPGHAKTKNKFFNLSFMYYLK